MIDKKLILIGFVLFLGLITSVNADTTGCCINYDSTTFLCVDVTLAECDLVGENYDFYPNELCTNRPQDCTEACHICCNKDIYGNLDCSVSRNVWGLKALGCNNPSYGIGGYALDLTDETTPACEDVRTPPPTNPPSVSGTVTYAGEVVEGAAVRCSMSSDTTDDEGKYELAECSIGKEETISAKDTSTGREGSITVALSEGQKKEEADIALAAVGSAIVIVNVKKVNNNPIAQAKVTVTPAGVEPKSAYTDAAGSAEIPLIPLGTIEIVVEKSGYKTEFLEPYELIGNKLFNIVLKETPTVILSGTTYAASISPTNKLGSVNIRVFHVDADFNEITDATAASDDTTGFYSMVVPVGTNYYLDARKAEYGPSRTLLSFTPEQEAAELKTENIVLQPAAAGPPQEIPFTVHVVNADNTAENVGGACVRLLHDDSQYSYWCEDPTNKQGILSIALVSGLYTLHVSHMDYKDYWDYVVNIPDSLVDGKLIVELEPLPQITVSGKVVDEDGPIQGATVSLLGKYVTTTSNGNFNFLIKVPENKLTLYALAEDYITQTRTIPAGQDSNYPLGNIELISSICNTVNSLEPPVLQEISFAEGKITLLWDKGPCTPNSYVVTRKKEGEDSYSYISPGLEPNVFTYDDYNVEPGKNHCYKIKAFYNLGEKISNEKCKILGPEECLNGDITFCEQNQIIKCEDGDRKPGETCEPKICLERSDSIAECVEPRRCDICNRPFGVFSQTLPGSAPLFGGKGSTENLFVFKSIKTGLFYCTHDDEPCYLDYSRTIVDKYYECTDENGNALVTSCYDYASKTACVDNKCLRSEECEWKDSDLYEELGIGVCRPHITDDQDCNAFDTIAARMLTNKVFASNKGAVAEEICKLYAESCYYSKMRREEGSCLNEDEVSCYDYNNKDDCIGPNDEEQSVVVSVTWAETSPGSKEYKKWTGSNEVTTDSNDYFNKRLCKFPDNSVSCIKDADDNEGKYLDAEDVEPGFKYGDYGGELPSDCKRVYNEQNELEYDPRCSADTSSPETIVPYREYVNAINFDYSVVDYDGLKELSETEGYTYFTALPAPAVSYPKEPGSEGKLTIPSGGTAGKEYTLFYFSEDTAHNLEEVKSFSFILDKVAPVIIAEKVVVPDLAEHEVDLTINLRDLAGEPISCVKTEAVETGLYLVEGLSGPVEPEPSIFKHPPDQTTADGNIRDEVSETYLNIDTGMQNDLGMGSGIIVEYKWECYDRAGNKAEDDVHIALDADMTISNPQPGEAVKDADETTIGIEVPISITSIKDGKCNYSSNGISWTAFNPPVQQESGDWLYNSEVTLNPGTEHAEYSVRCRLNEIQGMVYGTDADKIRITIDDKPPQTIPYLNDKAISFDVQHWVNAETIPELKCIDVEQDYTPDEIGCGDVHLCIDGVDSDPGIGCEPDNGISGQTVDLNIQEQSRTIRFYSADKLGNEETERMQIIKYDNDKPQITLKEPVDSSIYALTLPDIKEEFIDLVAEIDNRHGTDIAQLDSIGTYYVLRECGGEQIKNKTIQLPASALTGALSAAIFTITPSIQLDENMKYCIDLYSRDLAGNLGYLKDIKVIRDSLGPKLDEAVYKQKIGSGTTPDINKVEFGFDFELHISNLLDDYPGSTQDTILRQRVSQVWVEDQFGIRYSFTTENKALWEGIIKTRLWPVDDYTLTIFANDTVGNVAKKEFILSVVDRIPPSVKDFRIENIYSESEDIPLTRGKNHVIIEASESLNDNITLYFEIDDERHDVKFTKRDFEAITWVGEVTIPENETPKTAHVKGDMYDINGQRYKFDETVSVDPRRYDAPAPVDSELAGTAYQAEGTGITYAPLQAGYEYQFTVNGIMSTIPPTENNIEGFKQGANDVSIRAQDMYGYYEIFTQNVNVAEGGLSIGGGEATFSINMETIMENIVSPIEVDTIDDKLVTNIQTVEVSGTYTSDVSEIYIIGEDEKQYSADMSDGIFTRNVKLVGRTFTETTNNLQLVFVDSLGNKKTEIISIVKDLQPPNLIDLIFGRVLA